MSREYRRIEQYEEEILRMRADGYTRREICEKYGFKMKQLVNFITRYNRKQEKIAVGIALSQSLFRCGRFAGWRSRTGPHG